MNSVNTMFIVSTLYDVGKSWTMPNRRNNILPDFYRQYNNSTVRVDHLRFTLWLATLDAPAPQSEPHF